MSENTGQGESEDTGGGSTGQDPYVERLRPDPSQPPQRVVVLSGLLGNSDRPGYKRLYFNRALDYFAEFRSEDVVHTEQIPSDQHPMLGLDATRVSIRWDATIDYTWTKVARPLDEFDLDIRLGSAMARGPILPPETRGTDCPGFTAYRCNTVADCGPRDTIQITICRGNTCIDVCDTRVTCETCQTECGQATCATCETQCGQQTCATCQTCQTQCGQATCATCQTQCGQATCATCQTECGQATCDCETLNPHVFTCGPNPQCA